MTPSVAVVILTHNESIHLPRALASVGPIARTIHVVDSGSADETVAIARASGAEVLSHPFRHHADQFQWAIENITTDAEWVLRLDADEIIEPDLAARIRAELPRLGGDVSGITFDRKHIFMGRWIRHGGRYPLRLLRLFRRGRGRIEQRWMDEHIVLDGGTTVHFPGGFADHNLRDLTWFTDKHNKYATREALDVLIQRHDLVRLGVLSAAASGSQAAAKRLLKERVYNRLPLWMGPLLYFMYRYVLRLGFLDGREGLVYHVLQGFWYRFLVAAKVMELERAISGLATRDEKLRRLQQCTGLEVLQSKCELPG